MNVTKMKSLLRKSRSLKGELGPESTRTLLPRVSANLDLRVCEDIEICKDMNV